MVSRVFSNSVPAEISSVGIHSTYRSLLGVSSVPALCLVALAGGINLTDELRLGQGYA